MSTMASNATDWDRTKPTPGCCSFFVKRKHQFCKLIPAAGKRFCGEHLNAESSEKGEPSSSEDKTSGKPLRERIPCPLDPKHTVYADQLKKHLKKCNAREKDLPVYYIKGINRIGAKDTETHSLVSLSSLPKEELLQLIISVQRVYKAHSVDINSEVLNHHVLQDELSNPMNGTSAKKHLCQMASLLGQLQHMNLLGPETCYVEFGAGRGQMSHWVQQAVKDQPNVSFVLVDRAHVRHKLDTLHRLEKDGPSYERLKIDIEHLCLGKVSSVNSSSTPLVTYSKHLCGAATDLTLNCLMETLHSQQETKQDSSTTKLSHSQVKGILIALCCHHRCDWSTYVGRDWWLAQGLTAKDFMAVSHMSSWATCGTRDKSTKKNMENDLEDAKQYSSLQRGVDGQQIKECSCVNLEENQSFIDRLDDLEGANSLKVSKATRDSDVHSAGGDISAQRLVGLGVREREDIGRMCKRLIDVGRMAYLKDFGFKSHLINYINSELSLENVALIALPIVQFTVGKSD